MQHPERAQNFVREIWSWYSIHKRTLPWRDLEIPDDTQRAYMILVSEVMLQQTQVDRVKIVFKRFLEQFSSIHDLGRASNRAVIIAWQGMGYNSRALRLRDAAKTIVEEHRGIFPQDLDQLRSIKGIGPYTAAAIRNFAFHLPTPCIDTNIRRILHRTFVGPENADGTWERDDRYLLEVAEEVLNIALGGSVSRFSLTRSSFGDTTSNEQRNNEQRRRTAADWHAALMDFGSLVQTKRNPRWDICPLTAQGIMKTTPKNFPKILLSASSKEPGRTVAGKFIPNRIFRGRVVEELRGSTSGLSLEEIGRRIAIDWSAEEHREWLRGILEKLKRDTLIEQKGKKYELKE